ncbi:GntR family transcriptional regulator [Sulfitobacter geojensis]|uniref:GntR family transcriptional regulator n=1 Tax=Sulfitobacter geojensis TaxID=1342299 RepID=UPI003B8A9C63
MDSIDTELANRIRHDIIHGAYDEGARLSEAQLCEAHNVSRTPVRLALRILEREGLIFRGEGRGYRIRSPTISDILQAVQVRGHLESLAARLMALSSNKADFLPNMAQAIRTIDELISSGKLDEPTIKQMQAANEVFHTSILDACGNDYVAFTCRQISHLPMLAAGSMVFDRAVLESPEQLERGLFRLRLGNAQHQVIYDSIASTDPTRAERMMSEHSHTMVEYIEKFENRDSRLSVSDLVSYSAANVELPNS